MREYKYILNKKGKPVKEKDVLKWGKWFEESALNHARRVAKDQVGKQEISTVFLGLDHSFGMSRNAVPILYETMVFGGKNDQYQERYHTREEAIKGHKRILNAIKKIKKL